MDLRLDLLLAVLPAIVLFLYGIEHFSSEIQRVAGGRFKKLLEKATKTPLRGTVFGAFVTSILQSSTATTVITVSLVGAGVISFSQSLGLIFGANVGSTFTAQIVAFNLTVFAPVFIVLGFAVSLFGGRYSFVGKPLFYFGLVFFSLNLISEQVTPLKDDPALLALFASLSSVLVGVLVGFFITNLFQSSAVTSGLLIVFAQSGLLTLGQAIPVLFGANIGTTTTALVTSWRAGLYAKRAAVAHLLFNVLGVLLFLPFLTQFVSFVQSVGGSEAQQIANAHLLFNVIVAAVFLLLLKYFQKAVEFLVRGSEEEIVFKAKYLGEKLPESDEKAFSLIENEIAYLLSSCGKLFDEAMRGVEENKDNLQTVLKLEKLTDVLDDEISFALLEFSKRALNAKQAQKAVLFTRVSNLAEQLSDLAEDLALNSARMKEKRVSFSPEALADLRENYSYFKENLAVFTKAFPKLTKEQIGLMKRNDVRLRKATSKHYERHLIRLSLMRAPSGSAFVESLSALEAAGGKLREMRKLLEEANEQRKKIS